MYINIMIVIVIRYKVGFPECGYQALEKSKEIMQNIDFSRFSAMPL